MKVHLTIQEAAERRSFHIHERNVVAFDGDGGEGAETRKWGGGTG